MVTMLKFGKLFKGLGTSILLSMAMPLCSFADSVNFKLGPAVEYVITSFDGFPQAPEFKKGPVKQITYEEERIPQEQFAKINLEVVPGTKFDSRTNAPFMAKERLVLENVVAPSWEFISHLPKLKWAMVCYRNPNEFKQGLFDALTTCPSLTGLCIHGNASKVDLSCFQNLPFFKEIDFSEPDVPVKSMKDIAKIKGLEKLKLSNPKFTQEGIDAIANMTSLKHLSVAGEILKDVQIADFSILEKLPHLEYLRIVAPIRDSEAESLSKLKHVRFLCLGNVQNKSLIHKVVSIPSLIGADFWSTTVSNKDIDALRVSNIRNLHLGGEFEPGVFKRLGELTKLESLVVACPTVSNNDLLALKDLQNLKYLHCHATEFGTPYGASLLSKARPDLVMELTVGAYHGSSGLNVYSYYDKLHASVLQQISTGIDVQNEKLDELFCLADLDKRKQYLPLFAVRDEVALTLAKTGRLDKALEIQQASHKILLHLFEDENYKNCFHIPSMDLSNGVHAYILGKQKKYAIANEAFESATAQPGMFIGEHSKEISQIYHCYAEILKDEGKLEQSRIQENKAKFIRDNPPMMNTTHSTDTRYWPTTENPKPF